MAPFFYEYTILLWHSLRYSTYQACQAPTSCSTFNCKYLSIDCMCLGSDSFFAPCWPLLLPRLRHLICQSTESNHSPVQTLWRWVRYTPNVPKGEFPKPEDPAQSLWQCTNLQPHLSQVILFARLSFTTVFLSFSFWAVEAEWEHYSRMEDRVG